MSVFRFKQFAVCQDHAAMKVGTDGCILGALARGGRRVLDIGTGTGLLALMMAQRFVEADVVAVEIDADAARDAKTNFEASPWSDRLKLVQGTFQTFCEQWTGKPAFGSIVCNPPYFNRSLECEDLGRNRARHTSSLSYVELICGAKKMLTPEGVFSVILPAESETEFVVACESNDFHLQTKYDIRTVPRKPVKRVVMSFVLHEVDQTTTSSVCVRNPDNSYSDWYAGIMDEFLLYIPKP